MGAGQASESVSHIDYTMWQDDAARPVQLWTVPDTTLQMEIMRYGDDPKGELKPLLIPCSIEFPMPPSVVFCERLLAAGYQTIFIRRLGFGAVQHLPSVLMTKRAVKSKAPAAMEAVILKLLIETYLPGRSVTLLGLGTSNSLCMRLAQMCPQVSFTIFANPLFNPAIWDVIRPSWLRRMIRQTVLSRSGLSIGVRGLRAVLRRDTMWFYNQFAQKSPGDQAYIERNEEDFLQAGHMLQNLSPDMFYSELRTSLMTDTRWNPNILSQMNAVILSGAETTNAYKRAIKNEARRLGLPIIFAPSGDLFVPYASTDHLLSILNEHDALSVTALA